VPESVTVWGLLLPLSVIVSDAERIPEAEGVKITAIGQEPPAATDEPQVSASVKSLALVPVNAMLVMVKAVLPVLFRVTT
jgi:hypothetical protein